MHEKFMCVAAALSTAVVVGHAFISLIRPSVLLASLLFVSKYNTLTSLPCASSTVIWTGYCAAQIIMELYTAIDM